MNQPEANQEQTLVHRPCCVATASQPEPKGGSVLKRIRKRDAEEKKNV